MAKDKIIEATVVASSRSRGAKFDKDNTKQSGQQAQDDFTKMLKEMMNTLEGQLEVEPNANTLNNIINKKDKKKMN